MIGAAQIHAQGLEAGLTEGQLSALGPSDRIALLQATALGLLAPLAALAPAPTSPPPVAPTPKTTYPPGVVRAGKQAVWDLKTTAGRPSAVALKPMAGAVLPAGVTAFFDGGNQLIYLDGPAAALSGLDLSGHSVTVKSGILTVASSRIANAGGGRAMESGYGGAAGAGGLHLSRCDVDLAGLLPNAHGGGVVYDGFDLVLEDCRLTGAPRIYIDSSGKLALRRCYVSTFGLATTPDDHLEPFKADKGSIELTDTFIDLRDGKITGGLTCAGPFVKADMNGDIDVLLDGLVVAGVALKGFLYTLQMGATSPGKMVRLTIRNCALEAGSSGVLPMDPTIQIVAQANNFELTTGAPLVF